MYRDTAARLPAEHRVSAKLYRCKRCHTEKMIETNHYVDCYPPCHDCNGGGGFATVWECRELDFDVIIKRLEEEDNAEQ